MKDSRYTRRWKNPRWYLRRAAPYAKRLAPAAWLAAPLLAALLLPLAVVAPRHGQAPQPAPPQRTAAPAVQAPAAENIPQPQVSVYLSRSGQIETLPLEDYVSGVVAAEMPADFELEALKAQAVAARTFIARRLVAGDVSGVPVPGANVTDTVTHQAYVSSKKLKADFTPVQQEKIHRAVLETRGVIMTYNGQPITASFFASSGGYTENSEEYWRGTVPYLRSVASPWDKEITPNYAVTSAFTAQELISKLGAGNAAVPAIKDLSASGKDGTSVSSPSALPMEVLSLTTGHRIKEISIGGQVFTGREVREKLGLRSSQFSWKRKGDQILITTYGNGHGVGMSQWGANGMAKEGGTATQILKHYYTGITFAQVSTLLKK
ncbi:stage II sporulation protein D [Bacillus sp. FJAT-27264]|uniref:stage II sporulation protein D n=1 Tax=Paenibacillus sp. (strain DSM 101736 / FJAT-27264) TaxID=1850362 RepID=UPI000807B2EA|nr:stage II sporulation protein D [Bacillus sp. FJAT-27264]OBZ07929.1 stage II sporulation protein D [Bacillus sp. FJAT-27264]